ncbi:MAG: YibE/F family protein [Tissierellia bacterium]|nr:YibE/F family protein [Tissierellia bacterium]
MKNLKKLFSWIFVTIVILGLSGNVYAQRNIKKEYYRAKILSVVEHENDKKDRTRKILVQVSEKELKNEIIEINEKIIDDNQFHHDYKAGDNIIIFSQDINGVKTYAIHDYYRMTWVYYLIILFVVVLFVIGKKSGIKAILSMIFSILTVVIMIPLIVKGYPPILLAASLGALNTIITILVVAGKSKKSAASIVGTISGIVLSFVIAYIFGTNSYITGITPEETAMLSFLPGNLKNTAHSLLYAGVLLGSLGAVMDVTMSISSSIEEVSNADPSFGFKQLYISGMNVGRDIMGTMTNTLVLAYMASSLPLLVLIYSYNSSLPVFYNMDIIVSEIVRTIAGSIGIIVSIPITCLVAAILFKSKE